MKRITEYYYGYHKGRAVKHGLSYAYSDSVSVHVESFEQAKRMYESITPVRACGSRSRYHGLRLIGCGAYNTASIHKIEYLGKEAYLLSSMCPSRVGPGDGRSYIEETYNSWGGSWLPTCILWTPDGLYVIPGTWCGTSDIAFLNDYLPAHYTARRRDSFCSVKNERTEEVTQIRWSYYEYRRRNNEWVVYVSFSLTSEDLKENGNHRERVFAIDEDLCNAGYHTFPTSLLGRPIKLDEDVRPIYDVRIKADREKLKESLKALKMWHTMQWSGKNVYYSALGMLAHMSPAEAAQLMKGKIPETVLTDRLLNTKISRYTWRQFEELIPVLAGRYELVTDEGYLLPDRTTSRLLHAVSYLDRSK